MAHRQLVQKISSDDGKRHNTGIKNHFAHMQEIDSHPVGDGRLHLPVTPFGVVWMPDPLARLQKGVKRILSHTFHPFPDQ